jgi:hypothetical protein
MRSAWISIEHYRLHLVEEWPESPYKEATLAAIRSALESLTCGWPAPAECICLICRRREKAPGSMVVLSRDARTGRRSDLAA